MTFTLSPNVKALILDMDGVLWRGNQALLDLPAFFTEVKSLGYPVVFATNNGTRSINMYVVSAGRVRRAGRTLAGGQFLHRLGRLPEQAVPERRAGVCGRRDGGD